VGLYGSLKDFSVQEVIQIVSFGQKSGCLSFETPAGAGAVIFRDGRIVASFDAGSPPDASVAPLPWSQAVEIARTRIAASLDRLSRCRDGDFSFEPTIEASGGGDALDTPWRGIPAMDLLLELACRQDEQERDASSVEPKETSPEAPPPGADDPVPPGEPFTRTRSERSVLLVDDEELVRRLLSRYLVEGGYPVIEAGDVDSAVKSAASLGQAGVSFVLVADLNMPASAGDSFRGGIEVVKRLNRMRLRPPIVMMTDSMSSSLRAPTMRGVWSVMLKPGLSKLDPDEFEADMRAMAGRMVQDVLPRVCGASPARARGGAAPPA